MLHKVGISNSNSNTRHFDWFGKFSVNNCTPHIKNTWYLQNNLTKCFIQHAFSLPIFLKSNPQCYVSMINATSKFPNCKLKFDKLR